MANKMANKKKNPQDVFDALTAALYAAYDARNAGRSFDDDILELEDAFNRVMEGL